MKLYDNAPLDNYEELKTLYPVWYRDVLEMDALWKAFGPQLDGVKAGLTQAVDNGFVWTADEPTIAKLEQFLYIPTSRSKPLIERKTLVASFAIGNGHIGEQEIKEVIRVFTDGEIEVALVGGTVEISVTREISDRFNLADCLYILFKRLPGHLQLLFRDILKPILFENQNALHFRGFGVRGRFFNRGQTEPALLNGRSNLDGTWLLSQELRGVVMPVFRLAVSVKVPEFARTSCIAFSTEPMRNASLACLESFGIALDSQNKLALKAQDTQFGLQARQAYSISGSVTIDSMYLLDGAVSLNGSRKLNANIIKEDI